MSWTLVGNTGHDWVQVQVTIYLGEERSHWQQRTAAQSVAFIRITQPVSKTALLTEVVYGVVTGLLHTPDRKRNFWFTENKNLLNILVFTNIKIIVYTYSMYILLTIEGQNNGLMLWAINYRCSMRIYKYSMGFRTPAVDQSYSSIYYKHDLR